MPTSCLNILAGNDHTFNHDPRLPEDQNRCQYCGYCYCCNDHKDCMSEGEAESKYYLEHPEEEL